MGLLYDNRNTVREQVAAIETARFQALEQAAAGEADLHLYAAKLADPLAWLAARASAEALQSDDWPLFMREVLDAFEQTAEVYAPSEPVEGWPEPGEYSNRLTPSTRVILENAFLFLSAHGGSWRGFVRALPEGARVAVLRGLFTALLQTFCLHVLATTYALRASVEVEPRFVILVTEGSGGDRRVTSGKLVRALRLPDPSLIERQVRDAFPRFASEHEEILRGILELRRLSRAEPATLEEVRERVRRMNTVISLVRLRTLTEIEAEEYLFGLCLYVEGGAGAVALLNRYDGFQRIIAQATGGVETGNGGSLSDDEDEAEALDQLLDPVLDIDPNASFGAPGQPGPTFGGAGSGSGGGPVVGTLQQAGIGPLSLLFLGGAALYLYSTRGGR